MNFRILLYLVLTFLIACQTVEDSSSPNRNIVLKNIPMNSDLRCVGISVTVETLLEQQYAKNKLSLDAESFSKSVYNNLFNPQSTLEIPRNLKIDGKLISTDSKEAMNHLGTLISNIYKSEFHEALATNEGKRRLRSQQSLFLKKRQDIIDVLNNDLDKHEVFMGTGRRFFDDGNIKTTNHAFILGLVNDEIIVYDPNDPEVALACEIEEKPYGITVKWRCRYRDTGETTTQFYYLISKDVYFSEVLIEK